MNFTLVTSVISAVAGFVVAWQLQAHQIVKQELNHANERISIQRAARSALERNTGAVIKAQNDAAARVAVIKRESDATRASADGLREQIDITQRASATSIDASTRYAIALGGLLNQCAARYRELGDQATGHVSDLRTLMDAWPR